MAAFIEKQVLSDLIHILSMKYKFIRVHLIPIPIILLQLGLHG